MRPVASPAAFKLEPKSKRPRRDGATMSATPVRISNPAAARVHSVVEVARVAFKEPSPSETLFCTNAAMQVTALALFGGVPARTCGDGKNAQSGRSLRRLGRWEKCPVGETSGQH